MKFFRRNKTYIVQLDDDDGFTDVELGSMNDPSNIIAFLDKIDALKPKIDEMNTLTHKMNSKYRMLLDTTGEQKRTALQTEIVHMKTTIQRTADFLRHTCKEIQKENDEFVQQYEFTYPSSCTSRANEHGKLVKDVYSAIQQYQSVLTTNEELIKKKAVREVQILTGNANEEEVADMLEDTDPTKYNQFVQKMIMGNDNARAQNALDFLKEKRDDIEELEKSMIELQSIFTEIGLMVEQQQERFDVIFSDMSKTKHTHITKIEPDLRQGAVYSKKIRRKRWIMFGLFVACILIILLIAAVTGVIIYLTVGGGIPY